MNNSDKIILDLCGGTGAWSKPYKDAGYDVRLITLPDQDVRLYKPPANVYGILAAPPCTEFSLAKTTAPRDFKKGIETVSACLNIIWGCQFENRLKFWALENPRCILRRFLGRPTFRFEQWQYADWGIKPTDLWGYFNNPPKLVKFRPKGITKKYPNGSVCFVGWSQSAEIRATTPAGFAKAFYEANQ